MIGDVQSLSERLGALAYCQCRLVQSRARKQTVCHNPNPKTIEKAILDQI